MNHEYNSVINMYGVKNVPDSLDITRKEKV